MLAVQIISALIIASSLLVGLYYNGVFSPAEKASVQEAVRKRREEFGVTDSHTPVDDGTVHIVPYREMGING